jgi:glutamate/tyrosine decarboxylase-like PLP-dependent enzyme
VLEPSFFGYINGSGNQAAVLADLLASAINQICAKWHFSPAASEVEPRVIHWIAEFIGYPPDAEGCLLSGGSAGNLAGLAVARTQKAPFDADVLGMRGGAVDPLDALAAFCRAQGLWFHVDAAYGGPAARTDVAGALFQRLEQADSVLVNAHKWLYVPVEAACILIRQPGALRDTFRIVADYLQTENDTIGDGPIDFKDYGPQLSRSFRALKV